MIIRLTLPARAHVRNRIVNACMIAGPKRLFMWDARAAAGLHCSSHQAGVPFNRAYKSDSVPHRNAKAATSMQSHRRQSNWLRNFH